MELRHGHMLMVLTLAGLREVRVEFQCVVEDCAYAYSNVPIEFAAAREIWFRTQISKNCLCTTSMWLLKNFRQLFFIIQTIILACQWHYLDYQMNEGEEQQLRQRWKKIERNKYFEGLPSVARSSLISLALYREKMGNGQWKTMTISRMLQTFPHSARKEASLTIER